MPSKPKGVIDDLFNPVSRSMANQVRNTVRKAIAAERHVVIRKAKSTKTQDKLKQRIEEQVKIGTKQVTRLNNKGKKPTKALQAKRLPLAAERVNNAHNTKARTMQTAKKADKAEANYRSSFTAARAHFPDERSFAKAWREEKSSMRSGKPVPPTPKKVVKPKAKPVSRKKK